jgi:hypothetical protein
MVSGHAAPGGAYRRSHLRLLPHRVRQAAFRVWMDSSEPSHRRGVPVVVVSDRVGDPRAGSRTHGAPLPYQISSQRLVSRSRSIASVVAMTANFPIG